MDIHAFVPLSIKDISLLLKCVDHLCSVMVLQNGEELEDCKRLSTLLSETLKGPTSVKSMLDIHLGLPPPEIDFWGDDDN